MVKKSSIFDRAQYYYGYNNMLPDDFRKYLEDRYDLTNPSVRLNETEVINLRLENDIRKYKSGDLDTSIRSQIQKLQEDNESWYVKYVVLVSDYAKMKADYDDMRRFLDEERLEDKYKTFKHSYRNYILKPMTALPDEMPCFDSVDSDWDY